MPTADDLYQEAETLKAAGRREDAVAKLEEACKLDDSHLMTHLSLAVLLGKVNRHEDAIQHARRACEIDSKDPFNFTALSVTYQRAFAGTQNRQYIMMAEDAMAKAHYLQGK